jgi:AraC-like DNA-binding protein
MPKFYKKGIVDAVKGIKKSVDDNPYNGISTTTLASDAGISRNVLQEVFKARYGTSIGQYKLRLRMMEAQRLLGKGKSVKETALILRYSSISSFNNAFRNYYDLSPSEWINIRK